MDSIIQKKKQCYFTGYTQDLDSHHIFGGGLRDWSEKEGLKVWLRHDIHMALHQRRPDLERKLKKVAQAKYEETHSHEEFMKHVRKNYL